MVKYFFLNNFYVGLLSFKQLFNLDTNDDERNMIIVARPTCEQELTIEFDNQNIICIDHGNTPRQSNNIVFSEINDKKEINYIIKFYFSKIRFYFERWNSFVISMIPRMTSR